MKTEQLPGAPPEVADALRRLTDDLARAAGKNLAGVVLYGGLARGRFRPGRSDVNVVVLVHDASGPALTAIAPALRTAARSANVSALLLTPAEVGAAAHAFPTKFLDIKDHHVLLHGEDPFAALDVPREELRRRVTQELHNLTLRLRRRFVTVLDDPVAQTTTLAELARPLAIEVAALLRLAGQPVPDDDRTAAIFRAAATAFDLDGDALAHLAALRHDDHPHGDLQALLSRVLAVLARLTDRVGRLKGAVA